MALTFRQIKGSALTHDEMDQNLGTLYVSSSVQQNTVKLYSEGVGSLSAITHSLEVKPTLQQVCTEGSITSTDITANNFVTTSDRNLKDEITPIKEGLEVIKKIIPYEYIKGGEQDAGFIAQEVKEAIPYAVGKGEDGFLTMKDRPVLAHLHKALLEIEERLSILENKLG